MSQSRRRAPSRDAEQEVSLLALQDLRFARSIGAPTPSQLNTARSKESDAKHEQADQARPNRRQPRLISRYAGTREADQAAGDGSDDPEPGIAVI
ncbi:MAG TPA: hypothetical protein VN637_14310, partial [Roseiarcus sp.]|nr:hypothetical protein [Roseiarcus sp.]